MSNNQIVLVSADGAKTLIDEFEGLTVTFKGRNSSVEIGEGSVFHGCRFVMGSNAHVSIGTTHHRGLIGVVVNLSGNGKERVLAIGRGTSIEGCRFAMAGDGPRSVTVGENCMMSTGIIFRASDGHAIFDLDSGEVLNQAQPIMIGDHVWIGANATILKGSQVANNTVIGTHSLVSRKFEDENTAIAGVPAKVVRRNIGWDRQHVEKYIEKQAASTQAR
ncbi:acyltransferase [Microbacterium sp. A82]|uniref:acyltransferase n=1 Tax=Microbacterium sp. A82 TaxID=3450452 RepID=UPI003F2D7047